MMGPNEKVTVAQALRNAPRARRDEVRCSESGPLEASRWPQSAWRGILFGPVDAAVEEGKAMVMCSSEDPFGLETFVKGIRERAQVFERQDDACSNVSSKSAGSTSCVEAERGTEASAQWDEREFERIYRARGTLRAPKPEAEPSVQSSAPAMQSAAVCEPAVESVEPCEPAVESVELCEPAARSNEPCEPAVESVELCEPAMESVSIGKHHEYDSIHSDQACDGIISVVEEIQVMDMQVSAEHEPVTDGWDDSCGLGTGTGSASDQCSVVCEAAEGQRRSISRRNSLLVPTGPRARLSAEYVAMGVQATESESPIARLGPATVSIGVQVDRDELFGTGLHAHLEHVEDHHQEHATEEHSVTTADIGVQMDDSSDDEYVHVDMHTGDDLYMDMDDNNNNMFVGDDGQTDEANTMELNYELQIPAMNHARANREEVLPEEDVEDDDDEEGASNEASLIKRSLLFDDDKNVRKIHKLSQDAAPVRERLKKAASKPPSRANVKPREEAKRFVHLKPNEVSADGMHDREERTPNVRRSSRVRFPVLKFWKNERVVYERRQSMDLPVISEIIELENDSSPETERYVGRPQYHRRGASGKGAGAGPGARTAEAHALPARSSPRLAKRLAALDEASSDVDDNEDYSPLIQSSGTREEKQPKQKQAPSRKRRLVPEQERSSSRSRSGSGGKKRSKRRASTASLESSGTTPLSKQIQQLLASPDDHHGGTEARYMARFMDA